MAGFAPVEEQNTSTDSLNNDKTNYTVPLIILTSLFFIWGFITSLNDNLVGHFKNVFELNFFQALTVNSAFFGAYFVLGLLMYAYAVSKGDIIQKIGYKKGIIYGLAVATLGCLFFFPAANLLSFGLFLVALFVLASGITILQISANPYVTKLGSSDSASQRLTLTQAFNSLGTFLGPQFGEFFLRSKHIVDADKLYEFTPKELFDYKLGEAQLVQLPYILLAGTLVLLILLIYFSKLPKIESKELTKQENPFAALQYRHLVLGAVAIFMYVGGEVAIGSLIASYAELDNILGLPKGDGQTYIKYYWFLAMVGRFIGVGLMTKIKPANLMAGFAVVVCLLLLISMNTNRELALYSLIAIGFFNSIMFPTIFSLGVDGLGKYTSQGSSILVMMIVGGALIPPLQGYLADLNTIGLQKSFFVAFICYAYIVYYSTKGYKRVN